MNVVPELASYLRLKKWKYKPANGTDLAVQSCPFCGHTDWKFWINATTTQWRCYHASCGEKGNLFKLKRKLGDLKGGVVSAAVAGGVTGANKKQGKPIPMEHVDRWHARLLASEAGLAYVTGRGLTLETVRHFKLGMQAKNGVEWLAIPHISDGVCWNVKFRSMPPAEKTFRRIKGAASVLFNADALADSTWVVLCEAETDAMSFWTAGLKNVVGLTCGADNFLPEWYDMLADKERVIIVLDADAAGQEGARSIARRLGFDKCDNVLLPIHDANEMLQTLGAHELVRTIETAERFEVAGILHVGEVLQQATHQVTTDTPGLLTPWKDVNRLLGRGWLPGDLVVLSARVKTGKALAHGQMVLTPDGEKAIESVRVGDVVLSSEGRPCKVSGVFPQGERDVYRVTFSDGATLDVDGNHLWKVHENQRGVARVLSTQQIVTRGLRHRTGWRFSIPLAQPWRLTRRWLPLPPYLLGVLIGDGNLTNDSVCVSNVDAEVLDRVREDLPSGYSLKPIDGVSWRVSLTDASHWRKSPIKFGLRVCGLLRHRAESKFIPHDYLWSDLGDRINLLRGLMDTDGTVDKRTGQLSYATTSYQLALDVQSLAESLGGRASLTVKDTRCQPCFIAHLSLPDSVLPFHCYRKADAYSAARSVRSRHRNFRSIVDVTPLGVRPATCISVDAEDALFVCQRGIVTHNTTWALATAKFLANQGDPALVWCLEMGTRRLVDKVVASVRNKPVDDLTALDYNVTRYWLQNSPLYFVDTKWKNVPKPDDVFELLREAIKRYGVRYVVFDNLHFLCRSLDHLTAEIGQVTRGFKLLAEETETTVCLIAQPRKIQGDRVMRYDDLKDSSAIPADADQVILLHRNPIPACFEDDGIANDSDSEVLEPKTLVRFDAARFSGGGECLLWYDGATATFLDWDSRPVK